MGIEIDVVVTEVVVTEVVSGESVREHEPIEPAADEERPSGPYLDPLKEIRLAVVMYGGVSLCIYMNGVAQELFHLVRATSSALDAGGPTDRALPLNVLASTETAYRHLAQAIDDDRGSPTTGLVNTVGSEEKIESNPIRVKFLVDILSGSSAGGINAVFLAKALANDQPMNGLTTLWLDEGNIETLLNDKKATVPQLERERPPESLLSSQRMYVDLLTALGGMEAARKSKDEAPEPSPYVSELDLFVTTTDLNGVVLPVRFTNGTTNERRYRNVFHFRYDNVGSSPQSDFTQSFDPFLAFACRSTSAFPIAFKPMMLNDIDDMVSAVDGYESFRASDTRWRRFYRDYLPGSSGSPLPGSLAFAERPFADGGALDNKPFGYAIDTLMRRHAAVPVDRKLLFVEPDPDRLRLAAETPGRPNVVKNFLEQYALLPRQETVRDDVRRVEDFNRSIRRTDFMLARIDGDLVASIVLPSEPGSIPIEPAPGPALEQTIDEDPDPAKVGYRWLRVETTVEALSLYFCALVGVDASGDYGAAIRALVRAWRERIFAADPKLDPPGITRASLQQFLKEYDVAYRLRRLMFLTRRLDALYRLDAETYRLLNRSGIEFVPFREGEEDTFREAIRRMKAVIEQSFRRLESVSMPPRLGAEDSALSGIRKLASETGINATRLHDIYDRPGDAERVRAADDLLDEHASGETGPTVADKVKALTRLLRDERTAATRAVRDDLERVRAALATEGTAANVAVADFTAASYILFEEFDAIAFPLQYGSETGEGDEVEVIRVSPLDAHALTPVDGNKVTGARVNHFGAFLDRLWRENDIMWGRLDAAEILIESIAPRAVPAPNQDPDEARELRDAFVAEIRDEAHCTILIEQLGPQKIRTLLDASQAGIDPLELKGPIADLLQTASRCRDLLEGFRSSFKAPEELEPRSTLRTVGRAGHILGQMFRQVALDKSLNKLGVVFAVVARIGQLLAGLVEVSVPGTLWHTVTRHWIVRLYVFEGLAIAGGTFLQSPAIGQFGLTAFLATLGLNILMWVVARAIRAPRRWYSPLFALGKLLAMLIILAALVLAWFELKHLGTLHPMLPVFGQSPTPLPSP